MMDFTQAQAMVRQQATTLGCEQVAIGEADGRVLARSLVAPESLPPFDNSAMDGYALQVPADGLPAGARLPKVGELAAGQAPGQHADGAVEIMTGAPVPDGFNAVIPVEQVNLEDDGRSIVTQQAVQPGEHLRRAGEDIRAGETVLEAGSVIDAAAISVCAALGLSQVPLACRPRVALINTGNEVLDPATPRLGPGQIRNANGPYLTARLRAAGAELVFHDSVPDDAAVFREALSTALDSGAQVVMSTGAVSMGRYDFVPPTLAALGAETFFHKVAMRPGKPLLFARLPGGQLYFGLPGNPVSSAVGLRFFVEAALRVMLGLPDERPWRLPLLQGVTKKAGFRFHQKARLRLDGEGRLGVELLRGQESFKTRPLLVATVWAALPADATELPAGSQVEVYPIGHESGVNLGAQSQ